MNKSCYKAKLIRIQRLINIKITKAYRTVSNEALCVITRLIPINIKIEETWKYYEITKEKELSMKGKWKLKTGTTQRNT